MVDAPGKMELSLRTTPILWTRQDRHFYFRLFLLSRKASNAITRLPKAHNNVSMPRKIERISKAVIGATSLPMYSGKPVIGVGRLPLRSASVGVKQASTGRLTPCHGYFPMAFAMLLISFFLSQFNDFRQFICPYFFLLSHCLLCIFV